MMLIYFTKKEKDYARSIKRCLLFLFLLLSGISAGAQNNLYYGYVGDLINLPDPPDRGDWKFYTAGYFTYSENLRVDGTTGMVSILNYFEGTETVQCDYRLYRTYKIGTQMYTDWQTATTYFYIRCNPVVLTGLPNQISLKVGESYKITYSASPSSHWPQVSFIAADPNIITVDSYGKVTGMSEGNTYITVMNSKGPNEAVFVYVTEDSYPIVYADVESGEVIKGTHVTLSCNKKQAKIYYTTDGSTPSKGSMLYTTPITVNEDVTLKAIAYLDNESGPILTRQYTIKKEKITLSASPSGGIVEKGTVVTLLASVPGANIFYTMDGSTPTTDCTPYNTTGIVINEACILKARAYKDGYEESAVLTEKYSFYIGADSIEVSVQSKQIYIGQTIIATCTMKPQESNSPVTWTSDDPSIATVNSMSGEIEGIKEGVTYIRATTDNDKMDFCKLGVVKKMKSSTTFNDGIGIASVSSGYNHTLFVKKDGTLWACGSSQYGQVGDGTYQRRRLTPSKVMDDVKMASASYFHSMAVKEDGTLWAWGLNESGQVGDGSKLEVNCITPRKITDHVVSVSAGDHTSLILKDDSSLWACGANTGDGTSNKYLYPVKIMDDVSCMSAAPSSGGGFSYVVKKDGSLWVFGINNYGQLCDGTYTERHSPIHLMDSVSYVSTTDNGALVLKSTGKLLRCEYNIINEISDSVIYAAGGHYHSVYIKVDGSLWGFGSNHHHCLTDEEGHDSYAPSVKLMDDISSAEVGPYRTFIIKKDGTLWARGDNSDGELGDGSITDRYKAFKLLDVDPQKLPYSISISPEMKCLSQGSDYQPICSVDPAGFPIDVTWTSDDPSVATVDAFTGFITAQKSGTTFINAITGNGVMDWCKIKVLNALPLDPDVIELVSAADANNTIYNLSGQLVSAPQKGINIIRMKDGTTRKVLIK